MAKQFVTNMEILMKLTHRPTPSQALIEMMKAFLNEGNDVAALQRCAAMADAELKQLAAQRRAAEAERKI